LEKSIFMPTKKKNEPRHKRTIAEELHQQWRALERVNDAVAIAKELDVSKATIDKALIYGCVHKQNLVDGITKYFVDRIMLEKETAGRLKDLVDETTTEQ
jgi:endonuclease III-like uncharacterized protein